MAYVLCERMGIESHSRIFNQAVLASVEGNPFEDGDREWFMNQFSRFGLAAIAAALLSLGQAARADVLFDFEDQAYGSSSSISTTQGGLTATLYRTDGTSISVLGPLEPASWLAHSLLSYENPYTSAPLVINFSQAVSSVSIQFGDYNADDDTVTITAYSGLDGAGSNLGTNSVFYPATKDITNGDSDVGTIAIAAAGINSVVIDAGVDYPFSVYWDNLSVGTTAATPEPSTLLIGLAGIGLASAYSWRRRKTV